MLGVGRFYVAYPFLGAMRRPETRDRRGEKLTPTSFFIAGYRRSSIFRMLMRVTTSRGAAGRKVDV